MNRLTDNLYYFTAFALLATVAMILMFRYAKHQGLQAAYDSYMAQCEKSYPKFRCEVAASQYFDL